MISIIQWVQSLYNKSEIIKNSYLLVANPVLWVVLKVNRENLFPEILHLLYIRIIILKSTCDGLCEGQIVVMMMVVRICT
jgi:hypothetical protein